MSRIFYFVLIYPLFIVDWSNIVQSTEIILSDDEKAHVFISDDVFQGIIPALHDCWNTLITSLENEVVDIQGFWNDVLLKRLKPYHDSIREIDRAIILNNPATVLDDVVNISSVASAFNLSERTINQTVAWLDVVKDGWIKVAGMMAQLHFKYDWTFDPLYSEDRSADVREDLFSLNATLKQYFPWYNIRDLNVEPKRESSTNLVETSKQLASGGKLQEKDKRNLFLGLKELLHLKVNRFDDSADQEPSPDEICAENETIAGKRVSVFRYLPVYVLLHLLNGEFKYYVMQNVAYMYNCFQSKPCDRDISSSSEVHLRQFYRFYFDGIVAAFKENVKETAPAASATPNSGWRWKCDPKGQLATDTASRIKHVEDVTYTRFYDYQTVFVAEERQISLTKTCRDSCDMFDGSHSSIPCEESDWKCLEDEKDLDCADLQRQGLPCPGKARTLCPNSGIKCTTSKMRKVQICEGQRDWRYIEWLERGEGKVLGKKTPCSDKGLKNVSTEPIVESSGITKFQLENCEICICKCFEPMSNRTHRYISLQPQIADIENQKALVGIKFVKIDGVIYPKIAQASIRYGTPNASSIEWKDPVLSKNLNDSSQIYRLGRNSKNILLDDIVAPVGYVITGVRFVAVNCTVKGDYRLDSNASIGVNFSDANHVRDQSWTFGSIEQELGLEVQMTALSEFGNLKPETTLWKCNVQNTSLSRKQVSVEDSDEPTLTELPSIPGSMTNQYISVQSTSIKRDVGQTPIPFFDAQELIEQSNLTLVRGLGLFYKGRAGYGGFLGFRMLSLPFPEAPPWNPRYDLWYSKSLG